MSLGTCEQCGHEFAFRIIHNGFNETGYAYCDACGRVGFLDTHDERLTEFRNGGGWPGALPDKLAEFLNECACGGRFRFGACPRCPKCRQALSASKARVWIERSAAPEWKWQGDWTGCYCIQIEPLPSPR